MTESHISIGEIPAPTVLPQSTAPPTAALQFRDYRVLWLGALASNMGTWMQNVAQGQLLYALSGSTATLGVEAFVTQIPMVLLTLVGGALADRLERRKMLLITQSIQTTTALVLTTLTALGKIQIWHIFVLAAINGATVGINIPTFQALIGDLVPRDFRGQAITLNSAQYHTSRSIGPALVALVFWLAKDTPGHYRGSTLCFALNTASFGALLLALSLIRFRPSHIERLEGSVLAESKHLREGLQEAIRHLRVAPAITILLKLTGISAFCGMPLIALLPAYSKDVVLPLHAGAVAAQVQGHLMAAAGAGSVLGAIGLTTLLRRIGPQRAIVLAALGYACALIALSFTRHEQFAWIWMAFTGLFATTNAVQMNTRIQVRAPDLLRGRIMAIYALAFTLSMALGNIISGFVARGGRVPFAYRLNGVLFICAVAFVALRGWRVWNREDA